MKFRFLTSILVLSGACSAQALESKSSFLISYQEAQVKTVVSVSAASANLALQQFPMASLFESLSRLPSVKSIDANPDSGTQKLVDRGSYREIVRSYALIVNLITGAKIDFTVRESIRTCNDADSCQLKSTIVLTSSMGETLSADLSLGDFGNVIVNSGIRVPTKVSDSLIRFLSLKKYLTRGQWLLEVAQILGANNVRLVGLNASGEQVGELVRQTHVNTDLMML